MKKFNLLFLILFYFFTNSALALWGTSTDKDTVFLNFVNNNIDFSSKPVFYEGKQEPVSRYYSSPTSLEDSSFVPEGLTRKNVKKYLKQVILVNEQNFLDYPEGLNFDRIMCGSKNSLLPPNIPACNNVLIATLSNSKTLIQTIEQADRNNNALAHSLNIELDRAVDRIYEDAVNVWRLK